MTSIIENQYNRICQLHDLYNRNGQLHDLCNGNCQIHDIYNRNCQLYDLCSWSCQLYDLCNRNLTLAAASRFQPFRARTHAVLVIGLYELLGNSTTYLNEPSGLLHLLVSAIAESYSLGMLKSNIINFSPAR